MKFKKDFFDMLTRLRNGENFAYCRFSDGEICIMKNEELKLSDNHVVMGDKRYSFGYSSDDHKHFEPEKHQFLREALIDAYKYKADNYFVGGICQGCTCASSHYADWMHNLYGSIDNNLTSANLLVNSNYPLFVNNFIPVLKNRKLVFICSENADLEQSEFEYIKDFRVGKNCIVNDHYLASEIKSWIKSEKIKNHVFLFSASSLSEVLIYELYKENKNNTYIDIGTTLHPYIGLDIQRDYLKAFMANVPHPDIIKSCV